MHLLSCKSSCFVFAQIDDILHNNRTVLLRPSDHCWITRFRFDQSQHFRFGPSSMSPTFTGSRGGFRVTMQAKPETSYFKEVVPELFQLLTHKIAMEETRDPDSCLFLTEDVLPPSHDFVLLANEQHQPLIYKRQ
ncbi:hypothetical protein ATANTOWER_031051 [Ataeniobius toweri]|uniref:Uncharacterized protein n=1 Tax=Ataeniobius toweri TaxID=208326 RepID=A0ABU7B109_9TELE|nr:hypothetical protein [Ataeniobius toweri]